MTGVANGPLGDYPPERAALYETLAERTGPAPDVRCRCNLCCYGERPRLTLHRDESAA